MPTKKPIMPTLKLQLIDGCMEPYIRFYADEVDLGQQIMDSFADEGFDNCLPWFGVDYRLSETVLGEEVWRRGRKNAILLACGCGCSMCSSIKVDVDIIDKLITYSNFSTWRHGKRVLFPLGPITFDREQYEEAVRLLEKQIQEWRPLV